MTSHVLPDKHQTVWQLSAIQLSGWSSLPILATSLLVLQKNSFYGAALTILVGNALLWFIRFAIIAMSYKKRQSTLDIAKDYLGNTGHYFIGALCLISTLAWFVTQTTTASNTLTHLITINEDPAINQFVQISVLLGIISTFLCMEGITMLRKLSTIAFPFLLLAFLIIMCTIPWTLPEGGTTTISFAGLSLVLRTNLGLTSDLPTFFRHSKSFQNSIIALTLIQTVSLVLALCSLYLGAILTDTFTPHTTFILSSYSDLLRYGLILLVFLSVICANVANVYSASVGWEVLAPATLVGRKEYLILGLGLTTIFILISDIFSTDLLLTISDTALVNLSLVLVSAYLLATLRHSPPTPPQQTTYFLTWLLTTTLNTLHHTHNLLPTIPPLALSTTLILLALLLSSKKALSSNF